MSDNSLNTPEGLARLGRIVREARGHKSYRRFASESGLSEATVKRIEDAGVDSPSDVTFQKLARVTGRTFEDLKAIAQEKRLDETKAVHVAEDLIPLVNQLPDSEKARLAQFIVARLARMDVVMNDSELGGLSVNVRLMTNEQLGAVLKAIGDRLSNS